MWAPVFVLFKEVVYWLLLISLSSCGRRACLVSPLPSAPLCPCTPPSLWAKLSHSLDCRLPEDGTLGHSVPLYLGLTRGVFVKQTGVGKCEEVSVWLQENTDF